MWGKINVRLWSMFLFGTILTTAAWALPNTIRFQGRLTDSQGRPIVGSPQIRFEIYDAATDGRKVWYSPPLNVNSNEAGLFSVDIDMGPSGSAVFGSESKLFLQITVKDTGSDQALSPRQQLSNVPFAFYSQVAASATVAATANSVSDNAISNLKILDGAVDSSKILDRSILSVDLATNAVSSLSVVDGSLANVDIQDDTITPEKLNAAAFNASSLFFPKGVIIAFGGLTPPAGWLMCDGRAVSRTEYADLFSAIDITFGNGDGVTTFNLPDLRGRFLRGADNGAGRDPDVSLRSAMNTGGLSGDNVGSIQGDQYRSHNHGVTDLGHTHSLDVPGSSGVVAVQAGGSSEGISGGGPPGGSFRVHNTLSRTSGIDINNSGGNETRPLNAYVNYIIKS